MDSIDLKEYLSQRPYPGRGILLGQSHNGTWAQSVMAYFIMGRSENSRNRVFEETEDGIRTRAYDESKMVDPSLIIYHPVRMVGSTTIVTNGDQTDTIRDFMAEGKTFEEALRTREYEPDEPNFTPRISGLMDRSGSYRLSILKEGQDRLCQRQFFEYQPGTRWATSSAPMRASATPVPPSTGSRYRWPSLPTAPTSWPTRSGTASTRTTKSPSLCATLTCATVSLRR